jgi:hypothetical protein
MYGVVLSSNVENADTLVIHLNTFALSNRNFFGTSNRGVSAH